MFSILGFQLLLLFSGLKIFFIIFFLDLDLERASLIKLGLLDLDLSGSQTCQVIPFFRTLIHCISWLLVYFDYFSTCERVIILFVFYFGSNFTYGRSCNLFRTGEALLPKLCSSSYIQFWILSFDRSHLLLKSSSTSFINFKSYPKEIQGYFSMTVVFGNIAESSRSN